MEISNKSMLKFITYAAKRANYPGEVTRFNAFEILESLANAYPDSLADTIERGYTLAVRTYTGRSDDNYNALTDNIDSILQLLDIGVDYPGLYPTFELTRGGKKFTEYSALNALRQRLNYWNHWKAENV